MLHCWSQLHLQNITIRFYFKKKLFIENFSLQTIEKVKEMFNNCPYIVIYDSYSMLFCKKVEVFYKISLKIIDN